MIGVVLVLLTIVVVILTVPTIRQQCITSYLMAWVKKSQPKITPIEKDVLDSGNIWVEQLFFNAHADFDKVIQGKALVLTEEEQLFLDHQVTQFCGLIDDWEITHCLHDLPQTAWDYIHSSFRNSGPQRRRRK